MNAIHLFAGAGGSLLLGDILGWTHLAAAEIDPWCRAVLEQRWPQLEEVHGRLEETDWTQYAGRCDLVAAGWPCQSVSTAGKRLGMADPRDGWPHLANALRSLRPALTFLECSAAVLTADGGAYWRRCLADLAAIGMHARWMCLRASEAGAPHKRDRLWFVAWRAVDDADRDGAEWAGREEQLPVAGCEDLADPDCGRCSRSGDLRSREPGTGGCNPVADTDERGCDPRSVRDRGEAHEGRPGCSAAGCGELADADGNGLQGGKHEISRQGAATMRRRLADGAGKGMADTSRDERPGTAPCRSDRKRARQGDHEGRSGGDGGWPDAFAALCRGTDGLALRFPWPALDGLWPAPRGAAQEAWEPPRTCGRMTGRVHQLRALGNGWCVPQALLAWRLLTGA